MGAVRLLRTLAPLALVATAVTACNGSSSQPSSNVSDSTTLAASNGFEIRPVYARYAPGVPFAAQLPQALVNEMSNQACPMKPRIVSGLVMECDIGKSVYLLKNPIVRGNVASATPLQIGKGKIWYVEVKLASSIATTVANQLKTMTGEQLAFSLHGSVLTSLVVDSSFHASHFAITGNYNQASATQLAHEIAG